MATIYISVGSNVNREAHIRAGVASLSTFFDELTLSSVYESESVGFSGDPFYNMAISASTAKPIAEVVHILKKIEDENGRVRKCTKFSSRTLDLDLLTYDDVVCQDPVELPRGEITKNAFVLWPLAEIAPQALHPVLKQNYAELWSDFDKNKQALWVVDFIWPAH